MKNPKMIMMSIIAVLILGGAAVFATKDSDSASNNETAASESADAMEKKESDVMEKDDEDAMEKDDSAAMEKAESFVTLAEYNSHKNDYAENTKVYFFHASWCPICKGIEKEIEADPSQIPSGTTLIKTDYDSETKLRQKYGVTTQYTFVQIDNDGNQIAKWSATSLGKALAGIQS